MALDEDPLLDAARDCVLAVGVRRTTLTDVARRAGVSRMTLYRRYPDVTALLQALMTREFGAIIAAESRAERAGGSARERFVDEIVHGVQTLCAHPLFLRILDVDPELVLPYFVQRYGTFQRAVLGAFTERVADGQRDGSIHAGEPPLIAASVEMAMRGYVLSALAEDLDDRRAAILDELRRMLDRGLA